jgi:transcriptional regulator with XRE-family HTH domain
MFLDVHADQVSTKMLLTQSPNATASVHDFGMDTSTRKTVASNVKRLRLLRKWTQTDLAVKSGIAQTTISSVERAEEKSPTLDTLSQLAGAFDIPPWTLLVDADNLEPARMRAMDGLVRSFARLPPDGQDQVSRVADAEARYAKAG